MLARRADYARVVGDVDASVVHSTHELGLKDVKELIPGMSVPLMPHQLIGCVVFPSVPLISLFFYPSLRQSSPLT